MNLRYPYTVSIGHGVSIVLILRNHRHLAVLAFLHDAIVNYVELVIEKNFAIDAADDVVLYQN